MNLRQNHINTRILCALVLFTAGGMCLHAEDTTRSRRQWVRSTASDIEFNASNYGIFGVHLGSGRSGFVFPRSSGTSYMFGSGLWFGTKKRVAETLTKLFFTTFNPESGTSWATPGEIGDTAAPAPLYNSIDYNRDGLYARTPVPPGMSSWPVWLQPEQMYPDPLNTGTFVADTLRRTTQNGEYKGPAFFPGVEELMVSRFNDGNLRAYELTDTLAHTLYPLGLQFQQNVYSWRRELFSNVVLVQYQIVNMSSDTLFECVLGQASDPDIGLSSNDHIRFYDRRPEIRAGCVWSSPESQSYGALAMALIEAPMVNSEGFIDNNLRREFESLGRIGSFPRWPRDKDFATLADRYDFMRSGEFTGDLDENDQLALVASEPFSMRPGDTAYFAVAYIVLNDAPEIGVTVNPNAGHSAARGDESSPEMELAVTSLLAFYYPNVIPSAVDAESQMSGLAVAPNPARDQVRIGFTNHEASDVHMRITDVLGRDALRQEIGRLSQGRKELTVSCSDLAPGVYFVRLETERGAMATPLVVVR